MTKTLFEIYISRVSPFNPVTLSQSNQSNIHLPLGRRNNTFRGVAPLEQ